MTDYAKVSQLDAATTIASTDLIEISQDQGGSTFLSKKVEASKVAVLNGKTGYTHPNKVVLVDAATGLPVEVFLRGGLLTSD